MSGPPLLEVHLIAQVVVLLFDLTADELELFIEQSGLHVVDALRCSVGEVKAEWLVECLLWTFYLSQFDDLYLHERVGQHMRRVLKDEHIIEDSRKVAQTSHEWQLLVHLKQMQKEVPLLSLLVVGNILLNVIALERLSFILAESILRGWP